MSAEIEPLVSTARHMQQQGDETKITSDQPAKAMPRIVSLTSFCVVVLVWTSVFLFLARYFLFSAHEVSEYGLFCLHEGNHNLKDGMFS